MVKKINVLFSFIFLVAICFLLYKSYEAFQIVDCTKLTTCKGCSNNYSCSWCTTTSKCLADKDIKTVCTAESIITDPLQCTDCTQFTSCKTCSSGFSCAWCVGSSKCVSDLNTTSSCPRESTVSNPSGCDIAHNTSGTEVTDSSGTTLTCDAASSCGSCLTIPECYWCNTQEKCVGPDDVYAQCAYDTIYDSFVQCSLTNNLKTGTTGTTGASGSIDTTGTENIRPTYTGVEILPIVGLSRDSDGSLTQSSIQTIIDSLSARGYPITTVATQTAALDLVKAEMDFYKTNYKTAVSNYVTKSIDYISDEKSLSDAKDVQTHIQDLKDISRSIKLLSVSMFTEGFQSNLNDAQASYNNEIIKNTLIGSKVQIFWLANLVAIGAIFLI